MIAAFEFFLILLVVGSSAFLVSTFLLRHQRKNDKLKRNLKKLFVDDASGGIEKTKTSTNSTKKD